jgi:ubiquitin-protein ligase
MGWQEHDFCQRHCDNHPDIDYVFRYIKEYFKDPEIARIPAEDLFIRLNVDHPELFTNIGFLGFFNKSNGLPSDVVRTIASYTPKYTLEIIKNIIQIVKYEYKLNIPLFGPAKKRFERELSKIDECGIQFHREFERVVIFPLNDEFPVKRETPILRITIPVDYPFKPPVMTTENVLHPQIPYNGHISYTFIEGLVNWSPSFTLLRLKDQFMDFFNNESNDTVYCNYLRPIQFNKPFIRQMKELSIKGHYDIATSMCALYNTNRVLTNAILPVIMCENQFVLKYFEQIISKQDYSGEELVELIDVLNSEDEQRVLSLLGI